MKKIVSFALAAVLLLSAIVIPSFAEPTNVIEKASEWDYLIYEESTDGLTSEEPEGWLDGTDSEDWDTDFAPFSAPTYTYSEANTVFDYQYFSAFLRKTFTISDASKVCELKMSIIYDENPTVYINGTEVWSTTGYYDKGYIEVPLNDCISVLNDGENTICVKFSNINGGTVMDLSLSVDDNLVLADEEGYLIAESVTNAGFVNFGAINAPTNVLDMDQNTCTGSNFNADIEQSVTITFKATAYIDEVFLQCKDEGTTTNEDGTRGTYDIYAILGDEVTLIAENVPAVTGTDGGYTVTLDNEVKADAIKVVITSWQGDCWACVADMRAHQGSTPVVVNPPVTSPATGDSTAVIAIVAIAALLGMAVVVTKKVTVR